MENQRDQNHVLRLLPGEDLKVSVQKYINEREIGAGWLVTCVGSLTDFHIRFADATAGTIGKGHFEIVGLSGTLSKNGSHIHIILSDGEGKTIGGHLLEGCIVYTTAEIVLTSSSRYIFRRENDGSTPWAELSITVV